MQELQMSSKEYIPRQRTFAKDRHVCLQIEEK